MNNKQKDWLKKHHFPYENGDYVSHEFYFPIAIDEHSCESRVYLGDDKKQLVKRQEEIQHICKLLDKWEELNETN